VVRRIVIKGTSGAGKTTLSRAVAERLGVPRVELDALYHGPSWRPATSEELKARVAAALDDARGWVVDGNYEAQLGNQVLERAQLIVWLDLPFGTKLTRLIARTARRWWRAEELWNGNRESLRHTVWGRDALFAWMVRSHFRQRRNLPRKLASLPYVRLRSPEEVAAWLAGLG
jgi:adenylate kinase family enzyme